MRDSMCRELDLCARGFISQLLLWECISSGTNCLKKGRMDSLYGCVCVLGVALGLEIWMQT